MSAISRPKTVSGAPRLVRLVTPLPEHDLVAGDYIAVVPVDRFRGDGVYVLEVLARPIPYACSSDGCGGIVVKGCGERGTSAVYTVEQFEDLLLGQVTMTCKVIDPSLVGAKSVRWVTRRPSTAFRFCIKTEVSAGSHCPTGALAAIHETV